MTLLAIGAGGTLGVVLALWAAVGMVLRRADGAGAWGPPALVLWAAGAAASLLESSSWLLLAPVIVGRAEPGTKLEVVAEMQAYAHQPLVVPVLTAIGLIVGAMVLRRAGVPGRWRWAGGLGALVALQLALWLGAFVLAAITRAGAAALHVAVLSLGWTVLLGAVGYGASAGLSAVSASRSPSGSASG